MIRSFTAQTFNRLVGLALLTLMVLALIASPSAASRFQDLSAPAAGLDPAGPGPGHKAIRHEGE